MNRINYLTIITATCFLTAGCGGVQSKQQPQRTKHKQCDTLEVKRFALPQIPAILTSPQERATYVVAHYWDNFSMADTTYIGEKEVMEQAFSNYLYLLSAAPPQVVKMGVGALLDKAIGGNRAMYNRFAELLESYLYTPNSPMRNDEQYILVLEHIIAMEQLEEIEKHRPRHQLKMALKNRPGELAANFSYKLRTGQSGTLRAVKSEYTLLYLFNPDCHACDEVTKVLQSSPTIGRMLADKRMKILAVYPDEDMELWEKHKHKLPQGWMVGYDAPRVILSKELYDLRATPAMLLLDKDKRVIQKDIRVDELEQYLKNL